MAMLGRNGMRCRLLATIVLALSTVACGRSLASSPPAVTPSPVPPPTVEPTIAPTPTPVPCPADPAAVMGWFDLQSLGDVAILELAPGELGPSASVEPHVVAVQATLLGGTASVRLGLDDLPAGEAPTLTRVVADFVPLESTTPEPVGTLVDGDTVTLTLPDRDVRGVLRVEAAWTSSCGAGGGGGSIGVELLDSSVAEGCPTTSDGLLEQVVGFQDTTFSVGTLDVPIVIVGWSGRWTAASAIDDFPQFSGWDTAIRTDAAGETLPARDVLGDGIDYTRLRFAFFQRADVVAFLEGSLDEVPVVEVVNRNPTASGRMNIPMEFPPGAYVVEIQGTWQTPCLNLDSYTVVSLDRG